MPETRASLAFPNAAGSNPSNGLIHANVQFAPNSNPEPFSMMDLVYVGLTLGLFAFGWGLVKLCQRVG